MVFTVVCTYHPGQADRLRAIMAAAQLQNVISYTDHQEWQFWIDCIETARQLKPKLIAAELNRYWLTR